MVFVLTFAFGILVKSNGAIFRMGEFKSSFAEKALTGCHGANITRNGLVPCLKQTDTNKPSLILIGDSHANMLDTEMLNYASAKELEFYQITRNLCLFFEGLSWSRNNRDYCREYGDHPKTLNAWLKEKSNSDRVNVVVWAGRMTIQIDGTFDNREGGVETMDGNIEYLAPMREYQLTSVEEIIRDNFNIWAKSSDHLVIVYPIPEVGWNVPKQLFRHKISSNFTKSEQLDLSTSLKVYEDRNAKVFAILDSVQSKNVIRVYPHKLFCSEQTGRCKTIDENGVLYIDDDHLSPNGARILADQIRLQLDQAETPDP